MLRLVIFVSMLSLAYGLINIKSKPAKVANGNYVQLVCDVGTMENTVKWVRDEVTYFSCKPPFMDCFTLNKNHGYYDFSIKNDSLFVVIPVSQNKTTGNWSCYHGNEKADIQIDHADAPQITTFRSISLEGENRNYLFKCRIESQVPADVVIYSHTYLGVKKIHEMNQTTLTEHDMTSSVLCQDYRIFCNVSNGYGPPISDSTSVTKACPLKILHDLSPNTTLTFNETDLNTQLEFIVYFEGRPNPSTSFYRVTVDGIQDVTRNVNFHQFNPTWIHSGHIYGIFQRLEESDAGEYILTLKQEPRVTKSIILTLVYTGKAGGSIQRSTSMIPTVLSFLFVFFLVIVGVFWVSWIKRKPAGSVDPTKEANDILVNRRYKEDIRQNYKYLTQEIPLRLILPSLHKILHQCDYELLRRRSQNNSDWDCNQELLSRLQKREYWWRSFREALVSIDRYDIIRQLGWDEDTFDFGENSGASCNPDENYKKEQVRRNKHSRKLCNKRWMCISNKMTWLKDFIQQRMGNNNQNRDMLTQIHYQKLRTEEI